MKEIRTDVGKVREELTEVRAAQDLVSADLARVLAELRSLDVRTAETQQTVRDSASELVRLRTRLQVAEDELRQSRSGQSPRPSGPATSSGVVTPAPAPRVGVTATVPPAPSAPPEAHVSRAARESAEQTFAAAVKMFHAHEHGQAVLELIDFVNNYPKHGLAPRAQWWIGEAYFVQRDYQQALLEFRRVLAMEPGVLAASDALLRIGMCHSNLRQAAPALAAWQRIVREYPRSEAAGKARSLLSAAAVSP